MSESSDRVYSQELSIQDSSKPVTLSHVSVSVAYNMFLTCDLPPSLRGNALGSPGKQAGRQTTMHLTALPFLLV
jgi:hypothetical protein